ATSRHAPVTVRFLGWFGPRGLASIVFVPILVEQTELPERSLMLIVVTWTVALSVYAQRLTAWPGANRYGDWYAAHASDHAAMPESGPLAQQRIRGPCPPSAGAMTSMRPAASSGPNLPNEGEAGPAPVGRLLVAASVSLMRTLLLGC
ncbi:MAG TPA: hypothetical protein VG673_19980, partial [Actinomycetota bacterium]|nr:hypothetical protein [Actinomycetota bacterium]